MQMDLKNVPHLLFMDGINTGPTAFDGLPALLHFKRTATAPQETTNSTNADKAMTKIIRGLIF